MNLLPITIFDQASGKEHTHYIDLFGKDVIRRPYILGTHFQEGIASARTVSGELVFFDGKGDVLFSGKFDGVGHFSEGLCRLCRHGSLYAGFYNKTGNEAFSKRFALAGDFYEQHAAVSEDGRRFGFIRRDGSIAIKSSYEQARRFSEGLAAVFDNGGWKFVSVQGGPVIEGPFGGPRAGPFRGGVAPVCVENQWGLVRRDASWAIAPQFEDIGRWSEGHVAVKAGASWRYLQMDGNRLGDEFFEEAGSFSGGVAPAKRDGQWGLIDRTYKFVLPPQFESLDACGGGILLATHGDTYSYVDSAGQAIWTSQEFAMPPFPPFRE